jgi:hypothetical protein
MRPSALLGRPRRRRPKTTTTGLFKANFARHPPEGELALILTKSKLAGSGRVFWQGGEKTHAAFH